MRRIAICAILCASTSVGPFSHAHDRLPDSILHFTFTHHSNYYVRLTLFRPDHTFQDLWAYEGNRLFSPEPTTLELRSGTYTVSVQPDEVLVTFTTTTYEFTESLRFSSLDSPNVGTWGPRPPIGSYGIRLFPRIASEGLRNVSNRTWVDSQRISITGFIVDGHEPRWVLIRAAGPSLRVFGVSAAVSAPQSAIYSGSSMLSAVRPWNYSPNQIEGMAEVFRSVAAFPFGVESPDCAQLRLLQPGAYTVHTWADEPGGEVLTEVYELPYGN